MYIKQYSGNFTCKDLRTYGANMCFIMLSSKIEGISNPKKSLKIILEQTAKNLGHTPSITKKSYVCKKLIDKYLENPLNFKHIKHPRQFLLSVLLGPNGIS